MDANPVSLIVSARKAHERYWSERKGVMRAMADAYQTMIFRDASTAWDPSVMPVESPDAFNYVESLVSQLFIEEPGVEVGPDPMSSVSHPELIERVANRFLKATAEPLAMAVRRSALFGHSVLRFGHKDGENPLDCVSVRALLPWEVIVDRTADTWEAQSFVGHVYTLSLAEVRKLHPKFEWVGGKAATYFDDNALADESGEHPNQQHVTLIEFYDLVAGRMFIWSDGVREQKKHGCIIKEQEMPLRTLDGRPLPPLVPLYLSQDAQVPLDGYSALQRIYSLCAAKGWMLTRVVDAARKDVRKVLANKQLDDEALGKLVNGISDEVIPVEADGPLSSLVYPVPNAPVGSNWSNSISAIEAQLEDANGLPAFARGEATRATATEVMALQQYASSNLGRAAWTLSRAVVSVVKVYLAWLATVLPAEDEDAVVPVIMVDDVPTMVTPKVLRQDYHIVSVENAGSPMGGSIERANLLQAWPLLAQSQFIDQEKLMEKALAVFGLPANLMAEVQAPGGEVAAQEGGAGGMPGGMPPAPGGMPPAPGGQGPQSWPTEALLESVTGRKLG
jgi:hypothetical protein